MPKGKKVTTEIDVDRLLEDTDDGTENDETQDEGGNEEDGDENPDEGDEEDGDGGEDEGPDGSVEDDEGSEEELEASGGGGASSRTRRANRIRNLSKRLKEANTARSSEVEELKRKLEELERRPQQAQRQESAEEEAAKLALMTAEERIDYKIDKASKMQQQQLQRMQFQANDNADRQAFETLKMSNPLARKFSDRVEKEHRDLVSKGQYAGRSVILKYIVGEEAMKAVGGRKVSQQKKNGQRNIDRNRQNNGGQRSDVQANRQRGGKSLEERLEGKSI